ncbi:mitochondrial 2-enoyl thioester reductase [Linnemannia hyalina]|uniref:enoyl-[acyl-carrier-protein] reductase n=1 Tax=Linnemannia hyalina TaxID=64524 RepID=A0A9P7XGZ4_9FUNG|nr:mitochondrial 2-enoyl thioester reductase [Linnemannia hyalina]
MATRAMHASKAAAPTLSLMSRRTMTLHNPITRSLARPMTTKSFQHTAIVTGATVSQKRHLSSSAWEGSSGFKDLTRATALVYSEYGRPTEVLKVLKHTLTPPGDDAVQVQFLASPINPADINQIEGVYPLKPPMTTHLYSSPSATTSAPTLTPVAVAGNEGVAKVTKVGSKASSHFKVGDWVVMGSAGLGTWRSHGNFLAKDLTKVRSVEKMTEGGDSSSLDIVQLATLTVNPCTAYRMLRDFRTLSPGDYVIQNGANSGVGEAVIQLARPLGVKTINIIRNRPGHEKVAERLTKLGATHILTDDQLGKLETKELVKSWTKGHEVNKSGHLVTYGAMSRQPLILPASLQIFKNVHASGFWLTAWNDSHSPTERQEMIDRVVEVMKTGQFEEVECTRNQWNITATDMGVLEERLRDAVGRAASGGHGKQVFLME